MPTPKNIENHRRGRLSQKSSSFHAHNEALVLNATISAAQIRRPKTLPNLISRGTVPEVRPRRQPPKLLLNVTMLGSVGPVQVVMNQDSMVADLAAAAVRQYLKEGRRPILPTSNPSDYDLHYSQFSLESLDREEKLTELGSRNFFLCPRKSTATVDGDAGGSSSLTTSFTLCSKEANKLSKGGGGAGGFGWFRFMGFSL